MTTQSLDSDRGPTNHESTAMASSFPEVTEELARRDAAVPYMRLRIHSLGFNLTPMVIVRVIPRKVNSWSGW